MVQVDHHNVKFLEDREDVRIEGNLEKERSKVLKAHLFHNLPELY